MKQDKLRYGEPTVEIYVFEDGDVITFSQGNPDNEYIGFEEWDGNW